MHLANFSGYYFIYQYFIERSDEQMVKLVDNNEFNDNDLIELKLVLHLPYMMTTEYTRIEGEIEIEGIHYNYVKRKVSNDTLYLLCLPNREKTKLIEDRNDYTAKATDTPTGGKESNNQGKKSQPLNEYNTSIPVFHFQYTVSPDRLLRDLITPQLSNPFIGNSFQPPEVFYA